MYCFAKFCQICFYRPDTKLININKLDYDKIRIKEKLKCCIPEATFDVNLICVTCCVNLRRSYTFKQMCMKNQGKLNKYASILERKVTKSKPIINSQIDLEVRIEVSKEIVSLMMLHNEDVKEEEPVSLNKIPLNEWDSFETKYTCRCTKELGYGTNNLCSKCEGDLLGFQLSKIKVAFTNAGHNSFIKQEPDDTDSDTDSMDSVYHEIGFDDDDIQYSISYSNDVNNMLEDYENQHEEDESGEQSDESDESSEATDNTRPTYKQFQCPLCDKGFTRRYNLHNHYISHRNANVLNCPYCNEWFVRPIDLENHRRTHIKTPSIKKIFRHDKESNDFIPIEIEVPDFISNGADENITCATCDMSFTHKSRLAVHLLTHKKQFLCVECNKDFFRRDVYDAHIRTHLFEGKKYVCAICHDSFDLANVFIRHVKDHAENDHLDDENLSKGGGGGGGLGEDELLKKYPCGLCTKSYNYSSNLYRHMKRHNDYDYKPVVSPYLQNLSSPLRPYRCSECPKGYNHLSNLQRHMKTHADVNYMPNNVLLRKDIMMDSTESLDTLENRFCCTECDRSYNRLSNLQRHMRSHADASYIPRRSKSKPETTQNVDSENSLPNEYICTECNKSYSHLSSLQRHMKNHSNRNDHHIEMKDEIMNNIKQEEEDPVIIKQETKFDLDEDEKMLIHLSRQTDEGNLEISEPEISLSNLTYENLAQHTNNTPLEEHSHRKAFYSDASSNSITSQKKYQCCECDKSYNHSANLHRHLKTHNTARHVCTICFREFVRKDVFEKHFKTHAFQKIDELFSCKVCKRAFSYKQNLKRHMRTHPGYEDDEDALSSRSQVCPICKERVNNSLMRKHMLIHSYQKDLDAPQSSESASSATYKCNECSKVYLTHSSLVRHIFSHST